MKKIVFTLAMFSIAMTGYAQTPVVEGADGKVGIGTSTPATKLEIKSNEYKQLVLSNHGSEKLYLGSVWSSVGSFISNNSYYYSSHVYTALDNVSNGIQFRETGDINFFSNTGLAPNVNFLPTSRLSIKSNGNIGIGIQTAKARLHVGSDNTGQGDSKANMDKYSVLTLKPHATNSTNMQFAQVNNGYGMGIQVTNSGNTANWDIALNPYGGNIGIGTVAPQSKLEVHHSGLRSVHINPQNQLDVTGNSSITIKEFVPSIEFQDSSASSSDAVAFVNGNRFYVGKKTGTKITSSSLFNIGLNDGNVGIGTTDTKGFKLGVNGKIAATEVKVATYANWSDFVFEKEYKLPTLKEVENHIKEKGHLKDIPSATEVKKDGFFLGEMDAKLLQKIEELTLYTIEQEKELKNQKEEIDQLKNQNKELLKLAKEIELIKQKLK